MAHKRIRSDDKDLLLLFKAHLEAGWSLSSFHCMMDGGPTEFYRLVRENKEFGEINTYYKQARLLYRASMISHAGRRKNG